jgi:heat shock protein 1/8
MPFLQKKLGKYARNLIVMNENSVVLGAASHCAILQGIQDPILDNLLFIDVNPLSIGIETAGGVMTILIPRNTNVPCKKSQVFSTYSDNSCGAVLQVYEGENVQTKNNNLVNRYDLQGIMPAPRGVPQIGNLREKLRYNYFY